MSLTSEDWEKCGGVVCRGCGEEVVRIIEGKCPYCHQAIVAIREARSEEKAERRYVMRRIQEGTISRQDLREGRL